MSKLELGPKQRQWLGELRSGKYPQGRYYLCDYGKFCCLGVACEMATSSGRVDVPVKYVDNCKLYDNRMDHMPIKIREWLGLSLKGIKLCINYNDAYGLTFEQIADQIEAEPELFFNRST